MSRLGRGNLFARAAEGVALAFDSIGSNMLRSGLTILGVAIGVMVVIAIASMITGIKDSVNDVISRAGPTSFTVMRFSMQGIRIGGGGRRNAPWMSWPDITDEEARIIAALPGVEDINISNNSSSRVSYGDNSLNSVNVEGDEAAWIKVSGGTLDEGRTFSPAEASNGAFVAVINVEAVKSLFPNIDPLGKSVKLFGFPFTIVGRFVDAEALFQTPQPKFIIPRYTFERVTGQGRKSIGAISVLPRADVPQEDAMDQVIVALRIKRGLKPTQENNFELMSTADIMASFASFTSAFFLVMMVLSSIGLMVGGVGVVAIMMISVTERTREIGLRKAVGATHGEILFQFLIEATTLTVFGGVFGMVLGAIIAWGVNKWSPIPASIPLWSIVAAILASAVTGIFFGLYPANKAARLDPIEALRHE